MDSASPKGNKDCAGMAAWLFERRDREVSHAEHCEAEHRFGVRVSYIHPGWRGSHREDTLEVNRILEQLEAEHEAKQA